MKAVKYLFSLWAGVLVYTSLSFVFGPMGLSAYRQLKNEQTKQKVNIDFLKQTNKELENTMNSLIYDSETLTVLARAQGYASPEERFIRIVGLGGGGQIKNYAGEVLSSPEPGFIADKTLRIIGLCAGLSIFICLAFHELLKRGVRKAPPRA
ncbi:MAG: septum formation initiator family protein [Treponema sp.]|nr:septum formation initiator family protein [Treponema sp.]